MSEMRISRDKVVFVNLTEMDKYAGPENNLSGGGDFIDQYGYGHEVFNFRNDDGKCYGYAPPRSTVNLSRISNTINNDVLGDYVDDVLVVFTCSSKTKGKGRLVCGFYQHARVYSKPIDDNRSSRLIEINGEEIYACYNMICDTKNAFLIDSKDRCKLLPYAMNNGVGYGTQSLIWYVDEPNRQNLKNDLLDYVEDLINESISSDEYKYHFHDESRTYITSTIQIHRSQAAKAECIRQKGCFCNICGFDFEKEYGELGKDFIEVHHITPVGTLSSAEGYEGTDPQRDLIPLCSNCHSMIHRRKAPYKPDEIKELLRACHQLEQKRRRKLVQMI